MRLGINLPYRRADGSAPAAAEIMARARLVEEIGFDGIWMGDTVGRFDFAGLELAQRFMTLQGLSGGRFIAGIGAGSTAKDFEAAGVDFSQRFRLLRDGAARVKRLLAGETVDGTSINPWPNVQGSPPMVIGAWGSGRWLRRAAEEYDGWMASGFNTSLNRLQEGIQGYRKFGGSGRTLVATVSVNLNEPDETLDPDGRFHLNCPPEAARERLARLAELGFDDVLCSRLNYSEEDWPEAELRRLRELVPRDARSTNV